MPVDHSTPGCPSQDAPPRTPKSRGITVLVTLLKAIVAVAILWLVLRNVDLASVWARTDKQDYWLVLLSFGIGLLQIALGGTRWLIALRALDARPPFWDTLRLFYVSIFFNSWVPGGIGGDVMRAWLTYRAHVSVKVAVTSVILDRVAALVGIALLILLTMPFLLSRAGYSLTALLPVGLSLAGLAGMFLVALLRRLPAAWLKFGLLRVMRDFGEDVRTVFLRPWNVAPLVLVAMASQVTLGVATYTMAASLDIDVSLADCIMLMQPVALVANLPITIGGWGVREAAMIAFFGLVGVPAAASLALSVQLGFLLLAIALPGGLLWLLMKPGTPSLGPDGKPGQPASFAPTRRID